MNGILGPAYPWLLSLHILAFVAWMAGLFYLPRLFVYHVESGAGDPVREEMFQTMERRLLRAIMNPAMISTWIVGLLLIATGVVDWTSGWPWVKALALLGMTWFHMWCAGQRRRLAEGNFDIPGKRYRIMNEVPTVLLVVIVFSVIVKPF